MIRKARGTEVKEDKRKREDPQRLSSGRVDPEVERRLVETAGLTKKQIYNRRGPLWEKGLVALLDPGDTIVEVTPAGVVIRTREGTIQTCYNLDRPQPFLVPVTPTAPAADGTRGGTGETSG